MSSFTQPSPILRRRDYIHAGHEFQRQIEDEEIALSHRDDDRTGAVAANAAVYTFTLPDMTSVTDQHAYVGNQLTHTSETIVA
jgi:hypothetical protein